ncbi:ABC transporter [Streptomyces xiamenensis]|uniref:ABC transporter n=1 Tax=Streptomyces xiamenensis TaxID=408015 RepID=UPI003D7414C7
MSVLIALTRYQLALLLRSQRWLPPLLLYAILLVIGVWPGEPVLDGLGFAAAALLPVAVWLTWVCLTGEPAAARACAVAAAGAVRVRLGAALAGLLASASLGAVACAVVLWSGAAHGADRRTAIPLGSAALAALLAVVCCALLGTAVGVLGQRLPRGAVWSVPVMSIGALVLLVSSASPANAAVGALVTGSREGRVGLPLLPALLAALIAAAVFAAVSRRTARRPA